LTGTSANAQTFNNYNEYFQATSDHTIFAFDEFSAGTILNSDAYLGLSITARRISVVNPQNFAPGLIVGGINVNSQPNGISASLFYSGSSVVFDNGNDNFVFSFASPHQAAGLWVGNVGASNNDPVTPTTVSFFATDGSLLETVTLRQGSPGQIGSGANNRFFVGLVSEIPILSVSVLNAAGDGDGILIDDVQWAAPIPEPKAFVLFGVGIASVLLLRRRKDA